MEGCGETKTGPRARTGCCPFSTPRNQAVLSLCPTFLAFLSSEKGMFFQLCLLLPFPGNASVQELKSHSGQAPRPLIRASGHIFTKSSALSGNDYANECANPFGSFISLETELCLNVLFTVSPVPRIASGISLSNKYP